MLVRYSAHLEPRRYTGFRFNFFTNELPIRAAEPGRFISKKLPPSISATSYI